MATIKFIGRVHSPGFTIHVDAIPSIVWTVTETGEQWRFSARIVQSAIEVTCDIDNYTDSLFEHAYARAHDLVSACIDLGSFATGIPVTLIFDTAVDVSGEQRPLQMRDTELSEIVGKNRGELTLMTTFTNMVMEDYALAKALNDLTQSLHAQTQVAINCGRVLDGLRKIEAPDEKRAAGWAKLQSILNADKMYMEYITSKSTEPRHGDRTIPPPNETRAIQTRSWELMKRYLEYRRRGRQPLPLSDFPLLNG